MKVKVNIFASALSLLLGLSLFCSQQVRAEIEVDINRGFVEPMPIAVTDFYSDSPNEAKVGRDMAGVTPGDRDVAMVHAGEWVVPAEADPSRTARSGRLEQ